MKVTRESLLLPRFKALEHLEFKPLTRSWGYCYKTFIAHGKEYTIKKWYGEKGRVFEIEIDDGKHSHYQPKNSTIADAVKVVKRMYRNGFFVDDTLQEARHTAQEIQRLKQRCEKYKEHGEIKTREWLENEAIPEDEKKLAKLLKELN